MDYRKMTRLWERSFGLWQPYCGAELDEPKVFVDGVQAPVVCDREHHDDDYHHDSELNVWWRTGGQHAV